MYRQCDGYPSGHGQELADFLQTGKLVNGIGSEPDFVFNGMGCLDASMVGFFKKEAGSFYLEPTDARDCGEEYIYTIYPKNGDIYLKIQSGAMTFFGLPGTKQDNMNIIFNDNVSNFTVAACELAEKQLEAPPNDWANEQKD